MKDLKLGNGIITWRVGDVIAKWRIESRTTEREGKTSLKIRALVQVINASSLDQNDMSGPKQKWANSALEDELTGLSSKFNVSNEEEEVSRITPRFYT